MYDLTIIGAGPAGSSAAITAARAGAKVLLLEKGHFPRHKVCGEFVSSEALQLLGSLLRSSDLALLQNAPRLCRARLFVDDRVLVTQLQPPASSIARFDLDTHLVHAANCAGVDVRQQTAARQIEGDGAFKIHTSLETFESRAIINASGRWSNLSDPHTNGNHRPKWIGLKAHFAEPNPPPTVDLYFFDGGYCGVEPVQLGSENPGNVTGKESRINVCAMVRADVAKTLTDVFSSNPALRERSCQWQPLFPEVTTSPLIFGHPECVRGNILLAGDAAGFVDPFVGDGISLALRSGTLAARSLLPFIRGTISLEGAAELYRQTYQQEFAAVFKNSSRIRRLLRLPKLVRIAVMLLFQHTPSLTQQLVRKTR